MSPVLSSTNIKLNKQHVRQPSVKIFERHQKVQKISKHMARPKPKNEKSQKVPPRPKPRHKNGKQRRQKKLLIKSMKTAKPKEFKVVEVKCKLPSSTALVKKPPVKKVQNIPKIFPNRQIDLRRTCGLKELYVNPNPIRSNYVSYCKFATSTRRTMSTLLEITSSEKSLLGNKPSSAPQTRQSNLKHMRIVKSTKPPVDKLVNELPLDVKSTSECALMKKERATNTDNSFLVSTDKVLSDAHRLIWCWFFNGLYPKRERRKASCQDVLK